MSSEKAIIVDNITKFYGKLKAVDRVSFSIKKGEIFGLLGPNGAGKTTIIRSLIGLVNYSGGSCLILGKNVKKNNWVYQDIGVVFEESTLYDRLTGRENLNFFAGIYNIKKSRVRQLLQKYDLETAASRRVKHYSKGMKQRLLICRALLHNPAVIILDEPTDGLDPNSADIIRKAVKDFSNKGKTILLTTHYMEEADELCDRVAFLNNGRIISMDTTTNLKKKYGRRMLSITGKINPHLSTDTITSLLAPADNWELEGDKFHLHITLETKNLAEIICQLRDKGEIMSIHTQEASLAEVFRKINS